jgi:hypothetical protein
MDKNLCTVCGSEKKGSFCDSCKADTPSNIVISVSDTINIRDSLRVRKTVSGLRKWVSESLAGWFPSGDPKLPDGVDKSRTIDRETKEYHEIVKKYGTDEVIHEVHEPLDKHKK